jgi:Ca2+-binding RTX toxin-like protein
MTVSLPRMSRTWHPLALGAAATLIATGTATAAVTPVPSDQYPQGCKHIHGKALRGDSGPNTLWGSDHTDLLIGGGGDDALHGLVNGFYPDCLLGQRGADALSGGPRFDVLGGGIGKDTLRGGGGIDVLSGGKGNDGIYTGGGGDEYAAGRGGDDVINGQSHGDALLGNDGDDVLTSKGGNSLLEGGHGDDAVRARGRNTNDTLVGGPGEDKIVAAPPRRRYQGISVSAGKGDDVIRVQRPVLVGCGKGDDTIITEEKHGLHGCENVIHPQ